MANLQSIFNESGLQGIIPYGFDLDGPGYRFLCDKLKEGISFYVVADPETGLPYYFADSNHVYFNLYSTEEMAAAKCDEIAMTKRYTIPALLETSGWVDALWRRYRDLGATHVRLDDAVWVAIKDLASSATYEGIISFETPLRNQLDYVLLQAGCPSRMLYRSNGRPLLGDFQEEYILCTPASHPYTSSRRIFECQQFRLSLCHHE